METVSTPLLTTPCCLQVNIGNPDEYSILDFAEKITNMVRSILSRCFCFAVASTASTLTLQHERLHRWHLEPPSCTKKQSVTTPTADGQTFHVQSGCWDGNRE